jgi:hypothetical protein
MLAPTASFSLPPVSIGKRRVAQSKGKTSSRLPPPSLCRMPRLAPSRLAFGGAVVPTPPPHPTPTCLSVPAGQSSAGSATVTSSSFPLPLPQPPPRFRLPGSFVIPPTSLNSRGGSATRRGGEQIARVSSSALLISRLLPRVAKKSRLT